MQASQGSSDTRRRSVRVLIALCLTTMGVALLTSFAAGGRGVRRVDKVKLSVKDPRPVARAVEILEERYGWVITYEDPRYVHPGEMADVTERVRKDLHKFKAGEAPRVLIPKGGGLDIEYDVAADAKLPPDPAGVVEQLLNAQAASGNAGKFRLETNGKFMHVIATAGRNNAAVFTPQEPVLDALITVPAQDRSSLQKLEAIADAVSQATQTRVVVGTVPLKPFLMLRDQEGAAGQKARDVLVSTLGSMKGGGVNLSWQLFYDPGMKMYVLNVHEVPIK